MTVKQIIDALSKFPNGMEVKIDIKNPMGGGFLLIPSGSEKNDWEDFVSIVISESSSKFLFKRIMNHAENKIKELNEKIETTKKCLFENKHLLSDTVWVDDFTTLFDYLGMIDKLY